MSDVALNGCCLGSCGVCREQLLYLLCSSLPVFLLPADLYHPVLPAAPRPHLSLQAWWWQYRVRRGFRHHGRRLCIATTTTTAATAGSAPRPSTRGQRLQRLRQDVQAAAAPPTPPALRPLQPAAILLPAVPPQLQPGIRPGPPPAGPPPATWGRGQV